MKAEDLKLIVKEKYGEIAHQDKKFNQSSCCGSSCGCNDIDLKIFSEDYSSLKGYVPDADLGLGCGLPTEYAGIKLGDNVLDLGSGAGNDCFIARYLAGPDAKITGIDFTETMIEKARSNAEKLKYSNVEFILGDIEEMPVSSDQYDVVISNCVLNLVPDKKKAFKEIYRVLKPGGHFCISDVVLMGDLPEKIKDDAVLYAGCVSGAIQKTDYLKIIEETGFVNVDVKKEIQTTIPDEILKNHLNVEELQHYRNHKTGIFSVTIIGTKS